MYLTPNSALLLAAAVTLTDIDVDTDLEIDTTRTSRKILNNWLHCTTRTLSHPPTPLSSASRG